MRLLALVFAVCLLSVAALAVTIGWDAAPGATGYRVYHGGTSRGYTSVIDITGPPEAGTPNPKTQASFDLPRGTNFIAVTAFNAAGESAPSEELVFAEPMILRVERSADVTGPWEAMVNIRRAG